MKIWACAPATSMTSREASIGGADGSAGPGAYASGRLPKSFWASARTSAFFTRPLTASTMPPGT